MSHPRRHVPYLIALVLSALPAAADEAPRLGPPDPGQAVVRIDRLAGSSAQPVLQAKGQSYLISRQVEIQWEDGTPVRAQDLRPGLLVQLDLLPGGEPSALRRITILTE